MPKKYVHEKKRDQELGKSESEDSDSGKTFPCKIPFPPKFSFPPDFCFLPQKILNFCYKYGATRSVTEECAAKATSYPIFSTTNKC